MIGIEVIPLIIIKAEKVTTPTHPHSTRNECAQCAELLLMKMLKSLRSGGGADRRSDHLDRQLVMFE